MFRALALRQRETANVRNVRLYYPYWQYTAFFIFRCVSIYNFMEKMEIIRLYDCWTNGIENLRFDKEGYLLVLFFCGLFYKRIRKYFFDVKYAFPCLEIARKPLVETHSPCVLVFPMQFLDLPKFHSCLLWSAYLWAYIKKREDVCKCTCIRRCTTNSKSHILVTNSIRIVYE